MVIRHPPVHAPVSLSGRAVPGPDPEAGGEPGTALACPELLSRLTGASTDGGTA